MKLCRTGLDMFENFTLDDHQDAIPVDRESCSSSDEATKVGASPAAMFPTPETVKKGSRPHRSKRGEEECSCLWVLLHWSCRANSAAKEVVAKINTIIASDDNVRVACVEELLSTGWLERRTPLYFYSCKLLVQKRYRDSSVSWRMSTKNLNRWSDSLMSVIDHCISFSFSSQQCVINFLMYWTLGVVSDAFCHLRTAFEGGLLCYYFFCIFFYRITFHSMTKKCTAGHLLNDCAVLLS